ncbi:pyruvate, phosphate dikinase [Nocardia harenae]|uniref:pyruvate, phosphate dikinase n=1 Tax=Nocardia harenae TaxID=358707 RepID=UPI00082DA6B7|nr:pyruvate, phosphate dikinase [Nocardia harenae]
MSKVISSDRGRHESTATEIGGAPLVARLDGRSGLSRKVLGNKGFGIDGMRRHHLPVPPAFAITTEVCRRWQQDPQQTLDSIWPAVLDGLRWVESETGRSFGGGRRPLLVSVRSGAALSMPGMMDTVLDLGIDDAVEATLGRAGTAEFAADTRRRFTEMYRRIVLNGDADATVPADPAAQLRGAIAAVLASWNSPRARAYRHHRGLDDHAGTAVVVQAMVFGNLGEDSGTGVLFSRNPLTGSDEPFGEWLRGGQGEDVVSGTTDCEPLSALATEQPEVYAELMAATRVLEDLGTDVQDIEFTVENGRLWLLQTRTAKRSAQAAVRLALRFLDEGRIDGSEALRRVRPEHVRTLLLPSLQPETRLAAPLLAKGLAACPGVATGRAVGDPDDAVEAADAGEKVILVRTATSPDDVHGMLAAEGIVTESGGATSHAAVVSRETGTPAVVGCGAGTVTALLGRTITVDGDHGEIREGALALSAWSESDSPDLRRLTEIGLRHAPLRAHHPSETARLPHLETVDADTVRAALRAGHTDITCAHPLPAMLIAVQLENDG